MPLQPNGPICLACEHGEHENTLLWWMVGCNCPCHMETAPPPIWHEECSDPDCGCDTPDYDLHACEYCHRKFCILSLIDYGDETFACRACAKCTMVIQETAPIEAYIGPDVTVMVAPATPEHVCGEDAITFCHECGESLCAEHLVKHATLTLCESCMRQQLSHA
jgi:hypothetical protein